MLLKGKENLLFDTGGYGERYVLLERLKQKGIWPENIKAVFLSHCHYDHVLNCSLFPKAEFYLHESEYEYAMQYWHKDLVIPLEFLMSLESSGRLVLLKGEEEIYPGLKVLEVPGHTPGSIALTFTFKESTYVLAGDAVKNLNELVSEEPSMSHDPEASRKSISRIKKIADVIIPGHDSILAIEGEQIKRVEPTSVTIFALPEPPIRTHDFLLEVK